jgi:asparagine synthase (glutamine-hydrolysing)
MCGIAGWISYDRDLRASSDIIASMTKTMALRGPDAGGVWIDGHAGLGHRRLSVIDLDRAGLERVLSLSSWVKDHGVTLDP